MVVVKKCKLHTYLDGMSSFMYPGLWAVRTLHKHGDLVHTEGNHGLYELRFMHRLNIFQSCHGHSGWAGLPF
ncbi:uncharacterized protein EDB93DRAFT_1080846 [Suillus bovinus]|uniref:uncharacterized protein n=1 Tax=Suillus bovinus TaxID=48563 RepID=UPI001B87652A|nr:uncharacterized protein EDB93DRAFT_1080846 [Suillus bovinus]KAG2154922.1 hypothetical protein EDB93DRAFT_1080846 [Suillus bovinus]